VGRRTTDKLISRFNLKLHPNDYKIFKLSYSGLPRFRVLINDHENTATIYNDANLTPQMKKSIENLLPSRLVTSYSYDDHEKPLKDEKEALAFYLKLTFKGIHFGPC
jgi:hypothetical protein